MEALGPNIVPGLTEVPSLATMVVDDVLFTLFGGVLNLHIAFFLVLDGDMVSLSLTLEARLPCDVAAELAPLDPSAI